MIVVIILHFLFLLYAHCATQVMSVTYQAFYEYLDVRILRLWPSRLYLLGAQTPAPTRPVWLRYFFFPVASHPPSAAVSRAAIRSGWLPAVSPKTAAACLNKARYVVNPCSRLSSRAHSAETARQRKGELTDGGKVLWRHPCLSEWPLCNAFQLRLPANPAQLCG